jgi:hypothetical protein
MIALPFQESPAAPHGFKFRLLMNQYDEELVFTFIDDKVPNRGLLRADASDPGQFDQEVVTLDYQQSITQIGAEDVPRSTVAGGAGLPIHHEPGLWLYERNLRVKDDQMIGDRVSQLELNVARLASIPHGNSILAIGTHEQFEGMPEIPKMSGLPSGRFEDVSSPDYDFRDPLNPDPYLAPYKHYIDNPFMGDAGSVPGFPGFSPADMNAILRFANQGVDIEETRVLTVDTTHKSGGIRNLPFSVREAEPVTMKSTFWIQRLRSLKEGDPPQFRLQYSQVVMLQFFRPREDGSPGLAIWPHISIATLTKEPDGAQLAAV